MAVTALAVADLHFGLSFAAARYQYFASRGEALFSKGLFLEIADERFRDAANLGKAAEAAGFSKAEPTLSARTVGQLLGLGSSDPNSPASAIHRVQRAENTLERMAALLQSLSDHAAISSVLSDIRKHIDLRRRALQAARRLARLGTTGKDADVSRTPENKNGQHVSVWYGTNRRRNGSNQYVGERDEKTSYGRCQVFVPDDRGIGSLGRGLVGRLFKGDNRVKIKKIDPIEETNFWSVLSSEILELEPVERQGLVFLHGYCTSFEDAARRTAQLKIDLGHKGPAAFFAWPSLGSKMGYTVDEASIDASELPIKDFLTDFAVRSGALAVHIIAHSMGNRALLRALDAIAKAAAHASPVRFGQIFLSAPDIDAQLFQNLATAYTQLSARSTLYVTANDKAIGLSRRMHGYPRAGLAPPITVVPGIDTIDASHVNLGLIGHNYAIEMRPVLADIHRLLQNDTPPSQRFGLRRPAGPNRGYWEFAR